jgi:hypothetical protein
MTAQQRKDLDALLDYVLDDKERQDFYRHLRDDRGYSASDVEALDRDHPGADAAWRAACAPASETHAYAIAWRLTDLLKT